MVWLIEFISKNFGIGKDETANILVTIFTFLAGILVSMLFNVIKEYYERRIHRKIIKLNLVSLMKEMFRQANGYQKLSEQLTIAYNGSFSFSQIWISTVEIFYSLSYKNCYNAYFTGLENLRFNNKIRFAHLIIYGRFWNF